MRLNIKKRIKPEIFILIGIIVFFIITNIIWLAIDTLPPSWDDSIHMKSSLLHARLIPQIRSLEDLKKVTLLSCYYPSFYHISTIPIIYLVGFIEDYLVYINFLYLILLVLSVFGIARILFNERVGILSALLVLLYPIVFGLSRRYLLDFALVSMVSAVQYLILRNEKEDKKYFSFLLIIVVAAAVLTKQTAVIFFIPTMLMIFLLKFQKGTIGWGLLLSMFVGIILGVIRYSHIVIKWLHYYSWAWIFEKFSLYIYIIRKDSISPILFVFFLIGFTLLLAFYRRPKTILFLISWIVPALFVVTLLRGGDSRYLMASLPAFAIITVGGINALPGRFVSNSLLSFLVCIGLIQFFNFSFGLSPRIFKQADYYYYHPPLQQNWKIKEILAYVSGRFKNKNINIGIFPNCAYFNHDEFILYITLNKLPYSIESLFLNKPFGGRIEDCDIVITKAPFLSNYCEDIDKSKKYEMSIADMLKEHNFRRIKDFDLPDNSNAIIYKKYVKRGDG